MYKNYNTKKLIELLTNPANQIHLQDVNLLQDGILNIHPLDYLQWKKENPTSYKEGFCRIGKIILQPDMNTSVSMFDLVDILK